MAISPVYQLPLFGEKRCTKCNVPQAPDAFPARRAAKDGLGPWCTTCCALYRRAVRVADPEKARARDKANRERNRDARLAYGRASYAADPEKAKSYTRAYYRAHVDEVKRKARETYAADSERRRQEARDRRAANPDAAREVRQRHYYKDIERSRDRGCRDYWRDPVKARARAKHYQATHRETIRLNNQRHHASRRRAEGSFTRADIRALEQAQGGLCAYCGQPYGRYHVEHKQPLSRGGTNWPDNLCLACARCNLSKRNKTAEEFRAWRVLHPYPV